MAITFMTKEGYKKKMEEIAYLENVKRPEISRAIAEARDKGDLSENAEYVWYNANGDTISTMQQKKHKACLK